LSDDPGWGLTGDDPSWGSEGDGGVHWSAPFPVNGTVYEVKKSGKEWFLLTKCNTVEECSC